ncbi:MAG TPA: hypothetical protein VI915_02970 [Thermoplasmata archaeon]|nr:hypothetical protein [Thermoplasmata archaeon]
MAFTALDLWTFLTILLLTFAIFLVITGAFTAYFGSGKSRKIGGGLLAGGLIVGILWVVAVGPLNLFGAFALTEVIIQTIVVLIAAIIGAAAAIGLFLLAIMKS